MRDDEANWSDGRESYADSRRKIVVKICPKYQQVASTPEAAANYDRIFGEKKPTAELPSAAPTDATKAQQHFSENFDAIFGPRSSTVERGTVTAEVSGSTPDEAATSPEERR